MTKHDYFKCQKEGCGFQSTLESEKVKHNTDTITFDKGFPDKQGHNIINLKGT